MGQRHAVGIGPLRLLPKRRERRLRRIEFVDEAEVVPEVGNAEVEARRVLLDVVVVGLQVGLAVLDALLRRRGGRELVPDRHVGRHLAGHLYRVAGDREGGQLAGVGPHEVLRRRGGAGWPVELDDQGAVLDRCLPVLDEHAKLGGELELRAVDGHVDTERRAVADGCRLAAVVAVEKRLHRRQVDAHAEHARGREHEVERRLAVAVNELVDALGRQTAQLEVVGEQVGLELDLLGHARAVGHVDPVGQSVAIEGNRKVVRRQRHGPLNRPLQFRRGVSGKRGQRRQSGREPGVERDVFGERPGEQRPGDVGVIPQVGGERGVDRGRLLEGVGHRADGQLRLVACLAEARRPRHAHGGVAGIGQLGGHLRLHARAGAGRELQR